MNTRYQTWGQVSATWKRNEQTKPSASPKSRCAAFQTAACPASALLPAVAASPKKSS